MWGEASRVRPRPQGAGSPLESPSLPASASRPAADLDSFFRIVWARLSRQSSQEGNSKYAPLFNRSVEKGIIETIVLFSQRVAFSPAFIHQRMNAI